MCCRVPPATEPSAFFTATPQPTPLPSPTGSELEPRQAGGLSRAEEFYSALNTKTRRLRPHRNDGLHGQSSVVELQQGSLDTPVLLLTRPPVTEDSSGNQTN